MPTWISDAAAYRFVDSVWVITWAPFGSLLRPCLGHSLLCNHCPVQGCTYEHLLFCFLLSISIGKCKHKTLVIKIKIYICVMGNEQQEHEKERVPSVTPQIIP